MDNKKQWFEAQCQEQGICAEDIFVVGDCATNQVGDFLYSIKNDAREDVMRHFLACELVDDEHTYEEWLLSLMERCESGYLQGDEMIAWCGRKDTPWDMAQVFRECICRNEMLTQESREELRKKPVYGVVKPATEVDTRAGQYLGLTEKTSNEKSRVILPAEVDAAKGYRFALKMVGIDAFVEQYAYIRAEGQHGPFQILADLEKCVARAWQEKHMVHFRYMIYAFDDPVPENEDEEYYNSTNFRFSHFEIENELDEKYRTIYACYTEEYDL